MVYSAQHVMLGRNRLHLHLTERDMTVLCGRAALS